ncbi:peroxidase 4 [Quercus suber]|uniref:peroxidase n=1 Tax=Quercus suber TaxID=58331 RepID=A0AAW0J7W4_QUESU
MSKDYWSPTAFDNYYYKNLISQKGLLRSDQQLFNGGSTDSLVKKYSEDTETFYCDFVEAIIKMGDLQPLTGSSGEIRKNCRMLQ